MSSNGWVALSHHDQHKKLIAEDGTSVSASRYPATDLTEVVHYDPVTSLWTVIWLRRGVIHGVGQHRLQAKAMNQARLTSHQLLDAGRPALGLPEAAE